MISGSIVALVTPMDAAGGIDWCALERLIERQIEGGTAAIVSVGTTGESATLSVEENLTLSFRRVFGRKGVRAALDRAFELFPVLERRRAQAAGTLSGGEQRMLSMARVMVEVPKVLIADELSLGLAPIIVEELYRSLGDLRDEGTALLIVEQQVAHALQLADRVVMLDHGGVSWQGSSADASSIVAQAFEPVA